MESALDQMKVVSQKNAKTLFANVYETIDALDQKCQKRFWQRHSYFISQNAITL